jgi:phosphoribosylcarboxyaminoimidazole (NCAIR) mutase
MGVAKRAPRVAIIMGSKNDWEVMQAAEKALDALDIPHSGAPDPFPRGR